MTITRKMSSSDIAKIRTLALLENAVETSFALYDSHDSRTQKWSTLSRFAETTAYSLERIAPAAVELCELAADEYDAREEDYAGTVDSIEWWSVERNARRLQNELSVAFARHHGGIRNGQRECDCAECDALEGARDLAGWIGKQVERRVDHWSWDTYTGLLAARDRAGNEGAAYEWYAGQLALTEGPAWVDDYEICAAQAA